MKSKEPSGLALRMRQGIVSMTRRRRSSTEVSGGTASFLGRVPIILLPEEPSVSEPGVIVLALRTTNTDIGAQREHATPRSCQGENNGLRSRSFWSDCPLTGSYLASTR